MSNEFDLGPDFDFEEEFGDEIEDFENFDDLDDTRIRTAVLKKDNMVALLCIKTASEGAAICRVDPREDRPSVQVYDDAEAAVKWFSRSLRTSKQNGWQLVYDGLPLQG
jgi:hypothetical protein